MANLSGAAGDAAVAYNLSHAAENQPMDAVPVAGGEGLAQNLHASTATDQEVHHAPSPSALGFDATGWVAIAALIVILGMIFQKVPGLVTGALDKRIAEIRSQLDEAAQLRAEAEALKAEYQAKARSAEADAKAMREHAHAEAAQIVEQAKLDAAELMGRRAKMAEDKIAAAERQALLDVRAKAAEAATRAASAILAEKHGADADRPLIDRTIAGLSRLN